MNTHNEQFNIVAGTGCAGSRLDMLNNPIGLFVAQNDDLSVADYFNNRIQRFRPAHRNGTTMAGTGATGTINLNRPTSISLDANGYLFISDCDNHRVVRSGPFGFWCILGCSGIAGSTEGLLYHPMKISFDYGDNLYVADQFNHRIQQFSIINNICSKIL
jgi:hypothetical protein